MKMQNVLLQINTASHWWQFDSYNTGRCIGRLVKRFSKVPGAFQTSYDARPGNVCKRFHVTINDPTKRRTGAVEF